MRINHNIAALNTFRQLSQNNSAVQNSLEKLSSGLRINRAGDDAAGLAISEKMRGQIRGLDMAQKNAQDGISLIQTAEGALNETHSILQRMRELAVQSSSDTNTDKDRVELQKEVNQLANALNDISKDTEFNTKTLLDGSFEGTFHVGANQGQNLQISIGNMSGTALGVAENYTASDDGSKLVDGDKELTYQEATEAQQYTAKTTPANNPGDDPTYTISYGKSSTATWEAGDGNGKVAGYYDKGNLVLAAKKAFEDGDTGEIAAKEAGYYDSNNKLVVQADEQLNKGDKVTVGINISNQVDADKAITTFQNAIDKVSAERSKLGAVQNRLEHTINNLGTSSQNMTAAESRIRDVDYALAA